MSLFGGLHHVWRRLPAGARRRLFELSTEAVAPRPPRLARDVRQPGPPVLVVGSLSAATGIGEAGRLILEGALAAGWPASAIDLSGQLGQAASVPLRDLPPPAAGLGTVLLCVQPPNVAYALSLVGRRLLAGKYRLGCWAWDLETLPPQWVRQSRLLHEIAAPSRFSADAFARACPVPVRILKHPVAVRPAPVRAPAAATAVRFGAALDLGSTSARKNPIGAVRAFLDAFAPSDPARLSLKVRDMAAEPAVAAELRAAETARPGQIELLTETMSGAELEAWWREIDVFVSLHRSEGFGLLVAEAMARAVPPVSTDWSATAEFVGEATGWPVPYRLVPVSDPTGRYELPGARWAEPSHADAVRILRAVAASPDAVARKGAAAAAHIRQAFSREVFAAELGASAAGR